MTGNELIWKATQLKRTNWEQKYFYLWKIVLNKQFKDLAARIDLTNYDSQGVLSVIDKEAIEKTMISQYKRVGVAFARVQFQQIKASHEDMLTKYEDDFIDQWEMEFEAWVRTHGAEKITSIVGGSLDEAKKLIRAAIENGHNEGWGAEKIAREIRKTLTREGFMTNQWRALRIARTETVSASNLGSFKGAEASGYPMEKYWIATYDNRTRDTHLVMEQQNPKDMNEAFDVGGSKMMYPGDPAGAAEEVINCRCTIGFQVKNMP